MGSEDINQDLLVKDQESGCSCASCWCWFIQLTVWLSLIFAIISIFLEIPGVGFGIFGFVYLIYIITMFSSSTFSYLIHQEENNSMYNKMGQYFIAAPSIIFESESYHYEEREKQVNTSEGKNEKQTERVKIVTHRDTFTMPYYSVKDVSGLFLLDVEKANINQKCFIKLHLFKEINFADAISYSDYIYHKNEFWARNRYLDVYMNFNERRTIPNWHEYNLVQISNYKPGSVNVCLYILSIFFLFCELYKNHIDSFCINQSFKVRKLISTRYNLLLPEYMTNYNQMMPCLNLVTETFNYEVQNTGYCSSDYQVNLPTQEELESAQQYQSNIPQYGITSCGGDIGIVQDLPPTFQVNYNLPPPNFTSIGGDVALSQDQIRSN